MLPSSIVNVAGWLVFRFSLLSNCTLVLAFPVIMNPLFEPGVVTQPCTTAVASTEMNVLTVVVARSVATRSPCDGGEDPLTVNSAQGVAALTESIFTEPAEPT
jgi:hypothetical protein